MIDLQVVGASFEFKFFSSNILFKLSSHFLILLNSFPFHQVSYASGSPKFESRLTYPNTYRAAPSSTSYSKAKATFIKYYGWNRVAILHQYDPEFFSPVIYYSCTYTHRYSFNFILTLIIIYFKIPFCNLVPRVSPLFWGFEGYNVFKTQFRISPVHLSVIRISCRLMA